MSDLQFDSQLFYKEKNEKKLLTTYDSEKKKSENLKVDKKDEELSQWLWSMDDDTLFYPLGLLNQNSVSGRSVVVTWSEDYLINFMFKVYPNTNRTKVSKVAIDMPVNNSSDFGIDTINQILILELNTLLLMNSGRVYCFSSFKSIAPIYWLDNVRCIAPAHAGFCTIGLDNKQLCLKIYRDVEKLWDNNCTLIQRFDVTFDDQNLFNCEWKDEQYTLVSEVIEEKNLEFMENLLWKEHELRLNQEIYFFTISGNIFVLIPNELSENNSCDNITSCDYSIQLLSTYSSTIKFIKILHESNLCLIFLECGIIHILYMSRIAHCMLRKIHHTGTTFVHYDFCDNLSCFFYTDEEKVSQINFQYNIETDECSVQETHKAVPGIVVCTWVDNIRRLICINSNNMFYQMSFEVNHSREKLLEFEDFSDTYELTESSMNNILFKANVVQELSKQTDNLQSSIESEFRKKQLISVANKGHLYCDICKVKLELRLEPPSNIQFQSQPPLLIYTKRCAADAYFLIHLSIEKNDIFYTSSWQLYIDYGYCTNIINILPEVLANGSCIVIPWLYKPDELLPNLKFQLLSFVANENEYVTITLPVTVENYSEIYLELFKVIKPDYNLSANYTKCDIDNLIFEYSKKINSIKCDITKNVTPNKNIISFPKALSIRTVFDKLKFPKSVILNDNSEHKLYFLNSEITITYKMDRHCLEFYSSDAAAIYYLKRFFHNILDRNSQTLSPTERDVIQQLLLKEQPELECGYGFRLENHNNDEPSDLLHLEILERIYKKLRSNFFVSKYCE